MLFQILCVGALSIALAFTEPLPGAYFPFLAYLAGKFSSSSLPYSILSILMTLLLDVQNLERHASAVELNQLTD